MPLHNHLLSCGDAPQPASPIRPPRPPLQAMAPRETDPLMPKSETLPAESEARTLIIACLLTTFFFLVELIGGYIARSLAIMSDAAHLLSDLAGFAISLLAVSVSRLPPNAYMSFGFARAEVLGAFVSMLFIWALTAVLVVFAIERFFNPTPVDGPMMLVLGIVGLLVNVALGCVLGHSHGGHDHGHAHGHDHSHAEHDLENGHSHAPHDYSKSHSHSHENGHGHNQDHEHEHGHGHNHDNENRTPSWRSLLFGTDIRSATMRAAYLHVLGDALQNVGVILAAIIMTFRPNWSFIDPLCTLVFAVIVLMTTRGLARETMNVLMEGTPSTIKLDDVYSELINIKGVSRVGDLHAWSITARRPALSVHLYQKDEATSHDVVKDAQKILVDKFGIFHATVQVNCDTSDCCDDELSFDADSSLKNCVSYQPSQSSELME